MKRFKHNLSHERLVSCDMGELVPVCWYEALPGDSFRQSTSALLRISPLLAPVMHRVEIRFHHWFVPNRLVWEDWEKFITGGPDGNDASVHPTISSVVPVLRLVSWRIIWACRRVWLIGRCLRCRFVLIT